MGNDLYVGGDFSSAGGTSANNIAKWNGSSWSKTIGTNGPVYTFQVLKTEIFVGGKFSIVFNANGSTYYIPNILRTDGSNIYQLDNNGSITGFNSTVYSIKSVNDTLYIGGYFLKAGNENSTNFVKYEKVVADSMLAAGRSSYDSLWTQPVHVLKDTSDNVYLVYKSTENGYRGGKITYRSCPSNLAYFCDYSILVLEDSSYSNGNFISASIDKWRKVHVFWKKNETINYSSKGMNDNNFTNSVPIINSTSTLKSFTFSLEDYNNYILALLNEGTSSPYKISFYARNVFSTSSIPTSTIPTSTPGPGSGGGGGGGGGTGGSAGTSFGGGGGFSRSTTTVESSTTSTSTPILEQKSEESQAIVSEQAKEIWRYRSKNLRRIPVSFRFNENKVEFKKGSKGLQVGFIQRLLKEVGVYSGGISGIFDEKVRLAIIKFQRKFGLKQTGKADKETLKKLNEILSQKEKIRIISSVPIVASKIPGIPPNFKFTKTLKLGSKGTEVKYLQIFLGTEKYKGKAIYLQKKVTGTFGLATRQALIKFQEKYKLKKTGILDKNTRNKINQLLSQ